MSASRHSRTLQAVGVLVLLVGIGSAGLVIRFGLAPVPATPTNGDWQDSSLALTDSKSATRNIELYGGKVEVLMVRLLDWAQRPEGLALLIISGAVVIALGCFGIARHLPPRLWKNIVR